MTDNSNIATQSNEMDTRILEKNIQVNEEMIDEATSDAEERLTDADDSGEYGAKHR